MNLNNTSVPSINNMWGSSQPTSTVFSVSNNATVNANGGTYVAYLFAQDTSSTGIIQCNGGTADSGGVVNVTLGWEPQFVLVRDTSSVTDWRIIDNMRGFATSIIGAQNPTLQPNTSSSEGSSIPSYVSATGFTFNIAASANYIYMAIRRPNKPPTTGTQVYSPNSTSGTTGTPITTGFPIDWQILGINAGNVQNQRSSTRLTGVNTNGTSNSQYLITSSTAAEAATSSITLNWGNTGFQVPSLNSGSPIITWNFKRAPGFFDEVCYTGTGANTTQAHNLGAVPEMIIVKARSAATEGEIYVAPLGNDMAVNLFGASGAAFTTGGIAWNYTTPTSSVFSLGTWNKLNGSGVTFVAYLFATLAGISKVGSYTGNGTGQAIACGFSAGARFVLIKRTDSAGSWYTFDSARGLTSGSSPYLLLNSTAAEVTGNNGVYASTGGFTLGATAITTTNIVGASYIYLSVA